MDLAIEPVSSQVIPRDRHAAYFAALGVIASSIENVAVEIRHLQRTEVLEAEEFFSKGQKGSSAMPHKRNPILTENLTGLSRFLLALTQAGEQRESAYRLVQRNAMKVWEMFRTEGSAGEGSFLNLILQDKDVMALLSEEQVRDMFDDEYHLKHVDTIFKRVFGIRGLVSLQRTTPHDCKHSPNIGFGVYLPISITCFLNTAIKPVITH